MCDGGMSNSEHELQTSPGLTVCSGILVQQMHLTRAALGSGLPVPINKVVSGLTRKKVSTLPVDSSNACHLGHCPSLMFLLPLFFQKWTSKILEVHKVH